MPAVKLYSISSKTQLFKMQTFSTLVIFILAVSLSYGSKDEQDLLHKILANYDIRVRPTSEPSETVTITTNFYLLKFSNVEKNYWDEVKGQVSIGLWITMGWNDSRLSWKPSDYGNTKKMVIPSTNIWVPHLSLYTGDGAVEQAIVASENFSVTVKPNGEVYWVYPINRQIPCVHKTQKHGLRCSVSLEPNEANDMIHIVTTKNTVDTSLLGTYHDPTFKIEKTSFEIKRNVYPDAPGEKYESTKAVIYLEATKIRQD